jgi:hypothetical protein
MRKPKRSQNIAYRPCIVTFIDILGFKSIVSRQSASDINAIVRAVQQHAGAKDEEELVRKYGADGMNWTRTVFFFGQRRSRAPL